MRNFQAIVLFEHKHIGRFSNLHEFTIKNNLAKFTGKHLHLC